MALVDEPILSTMDLEIRDFMSGLEFDQLPDEVKEKARLSLVDLVATAVAGDTTPLAGIVTQYARDFHGSGLTGTVSRPLLGGPEMSPVGAALVGGMIIDAVDSHDGHSLTKGHVGCAVLPGLLAVIEAGGKALPGPAFMALLTAGYEIGTRSGIALHATTPDYHSSGAWNAVTCAALTAHLLNLPGEGFRHALGIAEYHGPRSQIMRDVDHPTMVKDGSGWGAMAGVSAGYLAAQGFTGAPAVSIVAPGLDDIWGDLGRRWRILEQYTKPYPVCRWAHPAIDAVLELRRDHGFVAAEVESMTIHTFHEATRLFQGIPETTDQAQYATAFPIAMAVLYGDVLPKHVMGQALDDPAARELTPRIRLIEDPVYTAQFPARRFARADVRLRDGRVLASSACEPRGNPESPLSRKEIVDKFLHYTMPVWGAGKSRLCLDLLIDFGRHGTDTTDLLAVLRS
ncbi:MmgE/PrpD family protein (plasmid) [Paracoccus yeei]|nr:MmgE/PrpD family protein [Paracoccus yeei]